MRSSPGDPWRNIDWVLLITQGVLTVAGCCIVYSASWTTVAGDPYAFVTRQVVFAIVASVVMALVMSVDYEWFKERAPFLYGLTIALLLLLLLMGVAQGLDRIEPGGAGNTYTWGVMLANGSLYASDMLSGLWQIAVERPSSPSE